MAPQKFDLTIAVAARALDWRFWPGIPAGGEGDTASFCPVN